METQTTSHWDRLPIEIQVKIMKMADKQLHREQLDQVCHVCHSDDVGVPITPCCQKPVHYECCPPPIHLHPNLQTICMILVLDGYRVTQQPFMIREMGWCNMQGQADSIHFTGPIAYSELSAKVKRTVNYVYHRVHGLSFNAKPREKALPLELVETIIQTLYQKLCTNDQYVVAYKGGTIEKDWLTKLNIPSVNLEWFFCPKVTELIDTGFHPGCSCGFHQKPEHHCPKQETFLFYQWLTEHP